MSQDTKDNHQTAENEVTEGSSTSGESTPPKEEKPVPYDRFKDVNSRRKEAEAELEAARKELAALKDNKDSAGESDQLEATLNKILDQRLGVIEQTQKRAQIESKLGQNLTDEQFSAVSELTSAGLSVEEARLVAGSRDPSLFPQVDGRAHPQSVRPSGGVSPNRDPQPEPDPIKKLVENPQIQGEARKQIILDSMRHRGVGDNIRRMMSGLPQLGRR